MQKLSYITLLLCTTLICYTNATWFKFKEERKPDLYSHWKGTRALDHSKYTHHGPYFGFTGFEHFFHGSPSNYAFKHAIPVAYAVPKLIHVPHPVPVTVERPVPIPVPFHVGKALGEYGPTAYDSALANYMSITQPQHHQSRQYGAPVYEHSDCHPYCDINLPQGSSPVPLITKEKRLKVQTLSKRKDEEDNNV